jgi:outer membrane biosynthesis protein TonB
VSSAALNELEQSLREQLRLSESALADRLSALHAVDDELVTLRKQQDTYDKVESICAALEELDDMGAGDLFWDDADENKDARLDYARQQIGSYHEAIVEVETRRDAISEEIKQQDVQLDYLHYDLQDIIEQEEAANGEWVLERDDAELPKRALVMPWARGLEEDKRFRISLGSSVAAALLFILLIGMIVIPLKFAEEEIVLDERIARLVLEKRALPPPPPAPEPEPVAEEEIPEAVPELVEEVPDEPVPANEQPQVVQEQPDIREKVKTAGILAFRDSFASSSQLQESAKLGSDARVNASGVDETGRPERKMVTSSAPGTSGGINLADISRDFGGGGGQIDGVAVSRVASTIGSGEDIGSDRPLAAGAVAGRTDEEIQIVFDRYKAALYRLYNRELRRDPTLRGQLVLRLTIEPDGSVSFCEVHSSSMDAPALGEQVIDRVKTFDFGAKEDIVAVTIIYPIDFLPAG